MDGLPDDLLLAVLRLLPWEGVLRARRVCRRWRDLVPHPDVWRHRRLSDRPELRLALRLAPGVAGLHLSSSSILVDLGVEAATTACAAAQLKFLLGSKPDAVLATLVLRNQAALGRLRDLDVAVDPGDPQWQWTRSIIDLLAEANRVQGLVKLELNWFGVHGTNVPYHQLLSGPGANDGAFGVSEPPAASLTDLVFWSENGGPSWLLALPLASHSGTLRRVKLVDSTWPPGLQGSLFSCMPHLEELKCPLLEDMHLMQCKSLKKLCLYPTFELASITDARVCLAVENAKAFFERATGLLDLDLRDWAGFHCIAASFVAALASSGRAKLERLHLPAEDGEDPRHLGLSRLSYLSTMKLFDWTWNWIPGTFLEYLATTSVPSLRSLTGFIKVNCLHAWLHGPLLRDMLARNPELHFVTYNEADCCRRKGCGVCAKGGCEESGVMRDLHVQSYKVIVCAHSVEGDAQCGLRREHSKYICLRAPASN